MHGFRFKNVFLSLFYVSLFFGQRFNITSILCITFQYLTNVLLFFISDITFKYSIFDN